MTYIYLKWPRHESTFKDQPNNLSNWNCAALLITSGKEVMTMCDIVWISPESHSSLSVKLHFLWHALQWHWPVRKWFSSDHWRRWRSKPGSRIVGSTTKVELTTIADCQSSLHRLATAIVCKSLHSGLRPLKWRPLSPMLPVCLARCYFTS